jgi:sedoheptulokinase
MGSKRKKCILGIDFGTTKIAVVLVDPMTKEIIASRSKETGSYIYADNLLKSEQAIGKIHEVFISCIKDISANAEFEIVSIGLTGQMHGILGLDARGTPVTNLVTWQDDRGNKIGPDGKTLLTEMEHKAGKRPIASGFGVVTLYDWVVKKNIKTFTKICSLPDYFGMKLTGKNSPSMDYSMAYSTGVFDIDSFSWDFDYISELGIDEKYFPDVVPMTTVTGMLNSKLFPNLSAKYAIPVSTAIGDNQASFIGSVKKYMESILINIGTGSQISFVTEDLKKIKSTLKIDNYDIDVRPFIENKYLVAGSAISGGCVYESIKTFFTKTGEELFGDNLSDSIWQKMENSALKEGNREGLKVYPLLAGKRSDPEARGWIEGLNLKNFTPSNFIYATLEGIAEILKDMIDDSIIKEKKFLVGSGNGLRKNAALKMIITRVFKKELVIPPFEEEAALGAAINGAVASGIISDFAAFSS